MVLVIGLAVVLPVLWWASREDDREQALEGDVTQVIRAVAQISAPPLIQGVLTQTDTTGEYSFVEPLILDMRPVPEEPTPIVDELGEWRPWDHEIEQPMLLGHILVERRWRTLTPAMVGMVAA